MSIRNYEVTMPPTSGEVKQQMLADIARHALTFVHIKAVEGDIPRADDELDLHFHISATLHPQEGGMIIKGTTPIGTTVNLSISSTPEEPAMLSLVVAE